MPMAKKLKLNPKDVAKSIISNIDLNLYGDVIESLSIDGPGFINIRLSPIYIKYKIASMHNLFKHNEDNKNIDYSEKLRQIISGTIYY
jgi:arginyl-tRNA synthetase